MTNNEVQAKRSYTVPLITITLLFFMWGFITCMNDILIPYLKQLFQLTFFQSMLVQFCFWRLFYRFPDLLFDLQLTRRPDR